MPFVASAPIELGHPVLVSAPVADPVQVSYVDQSSDTTLHESGHIQCVVLHSVVAQTKALRNIIVARLELANLRDRRGTEQLAHIVVVASYDMHVRADCAQIVICFLVTDISRAEDLLNFTRYLRVGVSWRESMQSCAPAAS